jgi:hypothetical protein
MTKLMARFETPSALASALVAMRARGEIALDASTPFPSLEVERALAAPRSRIPTVAFFVAALGGFSAWLVLWWTNAHDYALDVGGRPLHSFWTDVPIIFETSILSAGVFAFFAFFVRSDLPRVHHEWFAIEGLDDGFWLALETDAEPGEIAEALVACGAVAITSNGDA